MNENAAIDMLTAEHEVILQVVDGLGNLAKTLRTGKAVEPAVLREAVAFMKEFADCCHHAKEEDLLFPAFVKHGVPDHGCPIDALLRDHKEGRRLVADLAAATDAYADGDSEAAERIATAIDGIAKLYPEHIWKEDEMVFPMARRLLSSEERARLFKQFEEVEARNPPGTHQRFHRFADQLTKSPT